MLHVALFLRVTLNPTLLRKQLYMRITPSAGVASVTKRNSFCNIMREMQRREPGP
jgi:hypothetical protein